MKHLKLILVAFAVAVCSTSNANVTNTITASNDSSIRSSLLLLYPDLDIYISPRCLNNFIQFLLSQIYQYYIVQYNKKQE